MDLSSLIDILKSFIPEDAGEWLHENITEANLRRWRDQAEETKLGMDQLSDEVDDVLTQLDLIATRQNAQGALLLRIAQQMQIQVTSEESKRVCGDLA